MDRPEYWLRYSIDTPFHFIFWQYTYNIIHYNQCFRMHLWRRLRCRLESIRTGFLVLYQCRRLLTILLPKVLDIFTLTPFPCSEHSGAHSNLTSIFLPFCIFLLLLCLLLGCKFWNEERSGVVVSNMILFSGDGDKDSCEPLKRNCGSVKEPEKGLDQSSSSNSDPSRGPSDAPHIGCVDWKGRYNSSKYGT